MLIDIIKQAKVIAHNRMFWLFYFVGGLTLLGIALFHQYVLEDQPCVLCIHVRLWVTLFIIVSFIGLLNHNSRIINSIAHVSVFLTAIGLAERSYQLLGAERGFIFGDCSFGLGLPSWFPIDEWIPWMYRVKASCGMSPEIIFGITMAESLIFLSICLLLVSLCVALASFFKMDH